MDTSEQTGLSEAAASVAAGLKRPSLAPVTVGLIAAAVDGLGLGLGLWFTGFALAGPAFAPAPAALGACASALTAAALLAALGQYRMPVLRRFWRGFGVLALVSAAVAGAGLALGLWPGWADLAAPALLAAPGRALVALAAGWALDCGLTERRAVIVGGGAEAERLIRGLAANPDNDIRICGLFDDRDDARSPPVVIGLPKLGTVRDFVAFSRIAEIDMLIVALPLTAERRIRQILDIVRVLPLDVRLSAYSADMAFPRRPGAKGLIDVIARPLTGWRRLAKRGFDATVALAALIVLSPVLLAAAAAIRLDSPGPVFFRQVRHGSHNRPILVWKFRSMYADQCDPAARRTVTKNDPRVTRVGAVLRRWSVDELPQLLNVLRGELSLVGPRPHAVAAMSSRQKAFEEIVEGYAARHRVPPGVTGWAQINGWRGEVDDPEKLEARVAHDLYYIENWSFWLDLYILVVTPFRLLDPRGAY